MLVIVVLTLVFVLKAFIEPLLFTQHHGRLCIMKALLGFGECWDTGGAGWTWRARF